MTETAKSVVLDYVNKHPGTSFVELERALDGHIETEGEYAMQAGADPNIHFWMGMSERFVELIQGLLQDEELFMEPCQPLVYYVDGKAPQMDLVKRPPSDGYKSERWLPVAFYDTPEEERKNE